MNTTPEQQADQPAPMTQGRLADIRHLSGFSRTKGYSETADALDELLAEVRRLQQGEESVRQILVQTLVAAVAGYADAVIIKQQPMDVRHVASAVAQLGKFAREWKAERDAAVAEAAALREAASAWMADNQCSQLPQEQVGCICAFCRFKSALSRPGPGAALLEQRRAMEKLLRRLEWAGDTSGTECVCCYATKANGHAPGCELAALLLGKA